MYVMLTKPQPRQAMSIHKKLSNYLEVAEVVELQGLGPRSDGEQREKGRCAGKNESFHINGNNIPVLQFTK